MSRGLRIAQIAPTDPPESFPEADLALPEPNGLLAVGGDLSPARLIAAYRRGIFPWFSPGQPILWWSPDPRAVLLPDELRMSRSLRRSVRHGGFEVSVDLDFAAVIGACAEARRESGTWLIPPMITAYRELHALGFAHSVEAWHEGELVGGLYGLFLDGLFFGESMFSRRTDASKVALVKLTRLCLAAGVPVIDCQVPNPHLASLGCRLMPREEFLREISASRRYGADRRMTPAGRRPALEMLDSAAR
jgi:leucyl/phenylalanyl-tRNA--protein transferase